MCGITKLDILCETIVEKFPTTDSIKQGDKAFAYVKDYCSRSKKACRLLLNKIPTKLIDMNNNVFSIYNVQTDSFDSSCEHVPERLIEAFNFPTVPQIFVYRDSKWYYVGGCDTLEELTEEGRFKF
jgi:glutaredoxin-related protein